ncbi:hypothetical protein SUGI_1039230 [Cryptomeria japonica]|nr:hypothetical protein SUGI_1039230 [Cryptomeria japonica]
MLNGRPYLMGGMGFHIEDWSPNFDPLATSMEEIPVWFRLYNLPSGYKLPETLKLIGNKIGRLIYAEDVVEKKDSSLYSKICIFWRSFPPIPIKIEIISLEGIWKQNIKVEEVVENSAKV